MPTVSFAVIAVCRSCSVCSTPVCTKTESPSCTPTIVCPAEISIGRDPCGSSGAAGEPRRLTKSGACPVCVSSNGAAEEAFAPPNRNSSL